MQLWPDQDDEGSNINETTPAKEARINFLCVLPMTQRRQTLICVDARQMTKVKGGCTCG
jgi:hypothetical protein